MQDLVSILIPAFNAEKWIVATIQSALAQTWSRKEIIIVDDGSSDRTFALAKTFAGKDVSVLRQPNTGAAAARNYAFRQAQGTHIQWLDADDLLSADKVTAQLRARGEEEGPDILLSCPWGGFSYRQQRAAFVPSALWCDLMPQEWLLRKWEGNAHMQTATWLVSRELTEAAGSWDERLTMDDDGEYFSRVVRASKTVRFVEQAKVYYRITDSARLSHVGHSQQKMESQLLSMKLQIGYLLSMDRGERTRAACVNYLRTWLPIFYPDRTDLIEELQHMATELGATLRLPHLGWKYAWIGQIFGAKTAKRAQVTYNRCKSYSLRTWDRLFYLIETIPSRSRWEFLK